MPTTPNAHDIHTAIHRIKAKLPLLRLIASKKIRIRRQPAQGATTAPTPVNLAALDLLDQLHTLARMLTRAANILPHNGPITDLYETLDDDHACHALANRCDTTHIMHLLDQAWTRICRLSEPDTAHRYVGVCPWCGYAVWIPERHTGDWVCDMCRRPVPLDQVMAAHELRLLTSGVVGTAAELATLLRSCGYNARRKTICEWRRRGQLTPVAENEQGPVYALADVLRRLA